MFAACITLSGWAGMEEYIFTGETPMDIAFQINEVQDILCLAGMASSMEKKKNKKNVEKLQEFAERYLDEAINREDIEKLDINLSIGDIKCNEIIEGDSAEEQLKAKYPNATVQ